MNWRTASSDRYELLRAFARENRENMTDAEKVFWYCVKGQSLGHKFVRQHIIGDYIVDFLCRDAQLIVEIDGGYHSERTQEMDDSLRQQWLESLGYRVLRFTNAQVLFDIDNTLATVETCIKDCLKGK
ncbi:MAG: endonuclease domain-containing protein [Bacteroidales bacterium]|nr:endonuclease domain-containing protein [Bacteroidales bacterium]